MTNDSQPKIRELSQSVIEKIAAGEVIERPGSIVKELVENAIDAGATHIDILVEDAGFSIVKVVDNGYGMNKENLTKSLLPHATSKIIEAEDLYAVSTMGFRGEALASISAVSRFTITSNNTDSGLGCSLFCDGGKISEIIPMQHTCGTTVVCRDLFFNVPARKKFMKSTNAERIAITRIVEQIALSFPSIHFSLIAEGKRKLDLPQAETTRARIAQLAGHEFAKNLIYCSGEIAYMSVDIFISDPQNAKPRPRYQNLYVNLRRVDNDSVTYAVREAFSRFITSHLKASWFCFLNIEPSRIDVNIHPTKQKIKFDDEKSLFSFIFKTIHINISDNINVQDELIPDSGIQWDSNKEATSSDTNNVREASNFSNIEYAKNNDNKTHSNNPTTNQTHSNQKDELKEESQQTSLSFLSVFADEKIIKKEIANNKDNSVELTQESWNLIPCYQIHKMFILAPIKKGLLIIDQHAAHERILYEEALGDIKQGRSESQRLLFPVTFDMSPTEKEVLMASRDYFYKLGFDVQDFGGHTIAVSAMPATGFMKSSNVEEAVREMVQNLIEEKDMDILSEPQKRFAASFACGAAIKFGQELKQEEMNVLLNNLFARENPYICPHGRPTLVRISLEELQRRFLR